MNIKRKREKIGRNELCSCGSNLKYKKCCLKETDIFPDKENIVFNEIIKMSEVIADFSDEFLQQADTKSQKKKIICFACLAWNLGILAEQTGELPDLDQAIFLMNIQNKESVEACKYILSVLINKKLTEYADINRIIMNYEIKDEGKNNFKIDVTSAMSKQDIFFSDIPII